MSPSARAAPRTEEALDDLLSEPRDATAAALRQAPGDVVILGAGGKMGPTLARMASRAARLVDGAGARRVIAVSRFGSAGVRAALEHRGIETLQCDLLDPAAWARIPDADNVIFMAGQKFGTIDAPSRTWMMNVVVPALCGERFSSSRVVAFSTGNVYPLVPIAGGGATETTATDPIGEYASSCLGRERVFEHYAATRATRVAILRLNYAIDLRYGVLTDLAQRILQGTPIPIAMGFVNIIWQGDANRVALELLPLASTAPTRMNVSGTETLSVRTLATQLGQHLGCEPRFAGSEAPDALLTDTARMQAQFGMPEMPVNTMVEWVADWVRSGQPVLGKPTHFEARDGAY